MRRTIVVGDIHGCVDEFEQLVRELQYTRAGDRLLLLGDLIDRGPDPAGVVALAVELAAESIMGNHEEKALRWRKHEKRRIADPAHYHNPMTSVQRSRIDEWSKIPDEHWDWIATWPVHLHINEDWTAVHGGCAPGVDVEKQKPNEVMRMRYIDLTRNKMAHLNEAGEAPENAVHWTSLWQGPRKIVYGHYTYMTGFYATPLTLGIDTGCVHGASLTAAVFIDGQPGYELHSVKANKVYVERRPWNDSSD